MNAARVKSSSVLTAYIRLRNYPEWTAFYMKRRGVINDQFGLSHFNFTIDGINYRVLRTGCYPFIKYHCSKAPVSDLEMENRLYNFLKVINFGIPLLLYGITGLMFAKHVEHIVVYEKKIELRFWYKEDW